MKNRFFAFLLLSIFILLPLGAASAQTYAFSVPREVVDVYWESNGTLTLEYEITFTNASYASSLDVVDLGLPNENYNASNITATIDGRPVDYIERNSPYLDIGPAIYFTSNAIPAGQTGTFRSTITGITGVLYTDNLDDNYASAVFSPNYFGSEFVLGSTDLTVVYHMPFGVQTSEPRWHPAPGGFPEQPITGTDSQGRIIYTWRNVNASASEFYLFGASFPKVYVPAGTISEPNFFQRYGIDPETLIPLLICCCFALVIGLIIWGSIAADRRRRMKYLPPKIAIEGHGIKRGLTAPEAAILLEQPMDKVMSMILFSVIKKGAAQVAKQDPLELAISKDLSSDLRDYEVDFLAAFEEGQTVKRRRALQNMMVALVKSVANKMRGFSKRETLDFYQKITADAWKQVEDAKTPKVQSKLYEENLEWTMLDPNYDRRTDDVFTGRTVYAPIWWHHYNPSYTRAGTGGRRITAAPSRSTGGGRVSLPTLPGGDFAASVVKGTQNFAGGLIGSLADFTGGVTKVTNPPPPPPKTSGGGGFSGGGSSCACACAGCACACAGGGR